MSLSRCCRTSRNRISVGTAVPQIVDQLLEVDRTAGVLGRMDLDLAVVADREVSLAPSGDLVQLGSVGGGPALAHAKRGTRPADGMIHASHDIDFPRR